MASKPRVLILGGCGFIGRHLVHLLIREEAVSKIRVVDKSLPMMSYLSAELSAVYEHPLVEFKQANLVRDDHVTRAFTDDEGKYDWVFNLAVETRYGLEEKVYKDQVVDVAAKCLAAAKKTGVGRWIEVSTAQVYDAGKKASTEAGKVKPWTELARAKLEAEKLALNTEGLEVIVVRPSVVYGPGDITGLAPRLICGAVYKKLAEKMKFLWSAELACNTVHVRDVVRALLHVAANGTPGTILNISDKGLTTQGKLAALLERIFGIRTGFYGALKSNLARVKFTAIVEDANDMHMGPWHELCKDSGIVNTPLSPFIDKELLYQNPLCVDGGALEATGFVYEHPEVTEELLREQIGYFVELKLFPPIL